MTIGIVKAALDEASQGLTALMRSEATLALIARAGELMADAFRRDGRVYSCGNGGSLCDAMHFAEELSGKFRKPRPPLPAMAISDSAHLSCVANDYGYEDVFSRFVEAHGKKGDVLLAISTSGTSPNVLKAARQAKSQGVAVVALTGKGGTPLEQAADVTICTPAGRFSDRVQELHIKVIHILIELCEKHLFEGARSKAED